MKWNDLSNKLSGNQDIFISWCHVQSTTVGKVPSVPLHSSQTTTDWVYNCFIPLLISEYYNFSKAQAGLTLDRKSKQIERDLYLKRFANLCQFHVYWFRGFGADMLKKGSEQDVRMRHTWKRLCSTNPAKHEQILDLVELYSIRFCSLCTLSSRASPLLMKYQEYHGSVTVPACFVTVPASFSRFRHGSSLVSVTGADTENKLLGTMGWNIRANQNESDGMWMTEHVHALVSRNCFFAFNDGKPGASLWATA